MELYKTKDFTLQGNRSLVVCVGMLGIFMNQSNVMFSLNLSLADFMVVAILILLLINHKFELPAKVMTVFFFFSFFLLVNSTIIIPVIHNLPVEVTFLMKDYLKLLVSLLYFIIGIHVAKHELAAGLLKWFLIFSTIIGLLGITTFFLPLPGLSGVLLYAGSRLTGLMNDPNYFGVIQCAALAVLLRIKVKYPWVKIVSATILILSIFGSGSKTGFITLTGLLLFHIFHFIKEGKLKGFNLFYSLVLLFAVFLLFPVINEVFADTMAVLVERFPIFSRVQLLLTDFDRAVSEGGSSRNVQWKIGLDLIQKHPLIGVGIGNNYLSLAYKITPRASIAHNTYIQMVAEWGIPVTVFLFLFVGKIFTTDVANKHEEQLILTVKGMFFAFLVGSMAISFNYSRMFWLLLGMLAFYSSVTEGKTKKYE